MTPQSCYESLRFLLCLWMFATPYGQVIFESQHLRLGFSEADPKTKFCVQVTNYRNVQGVLEKDGSLGQNEEEAQEVWDLSWNSMNPLWKEDLCLDPLWNADIEVTSQSCHKSRQGELGEGITPTDVHCWLKSDSGEHGLPGTSTQVLSYRPEGSHGQRAVLLLQRASGPEIRVWGRGRCRCMKIAK